MKSAAGLNRFLLPAVMLAVFLASLDQTIISTALPNITNDLSGAHLYTWVFTSYLLASTIFVPISGAMGDLYGRRPILLFSVLIFTVASLLAGFSSSVESLILFRGLQGVGAGIITANAFALLGDIYPDGKKARAIGLMTAIYGLSGAIGPFIGGFITDSLSWRWVFWINVPMCSLMLVILFFTLPSVTTEFNEKLDVKGIFSFVGFLLPLLILIHYLGEGVSLLEPNMLLLLALTFIVSIIFYKTETKASYPIINLGLFVNKTFSFSMLAMFIISLAMYAALMYAPLLFQHVMNLSATESGAVTSPMVIALAITSIIAGRLVERGISIRVSSSIGVLIASSGLLFLSLLNDESGKSEIALSMFVFGAGLGFTMPTLLLAAQNSTADRFMGIATSLGKFFRSVGGLVGVGVAGAIVRFYEVDTHNLGEAISSMMFIMSAVMLSTLAFTLFVSMSQSLGNSDT